MLAVLSPAKKLNFETPRDLAPHSQPDFMPEIETLVDEARKLTSDDLKRLMGISDKLADLNRDRFKAFSAPFDLGNAKQAALVFNGDTYSGLRAPEFTDEEFDYAQDHVRILSGLYGVLRPLDLMQPYRLEMGIKFKNPEGEDLYDFWRPRLAEKLDEATAGQSDRTIVNCASNEYFKAVDTAKLASPVITPVFKEIKDGQARVIGMFAKKARGAMARFMVEHRIDTPEGLKDFNVDGYSFQADLSDTATFTFTRDQSKKAAA